MAKGRKRKFGRREQNGRLARAKPIDTAQIAARMPHRASNVIWATFKNGTAEVQRIVRSFVPVDQLKTELAETPLGRLCLVNAISRLQYDAGLQFGRDARNYNRAIDCPRGHAVSIAGFAQAKGCQSIMDDELALRLVEKYRNAARSLGNKPLLNVMSHVVIFEHEPSPEMFIDLLVALSRLVSHYGLTSGNKSCMCQ